MGNGVADDKVVYAYVPDMITYYLDEAPLLANVPTYPCVDPDRRAEVLDRLDALVLKPVDGYGGQGIVIGPHASREELAELADGDHGRGPRPGWRRTSSGSPPTRRSPATSWSRARWTCGRS